MNYRNTQKQIEWNVRAWSNSLPSQKASGGTKVVVEYAPTWLARSAVTLMYEDTFPLTPSQGPGVMGQLYTRPVRFCLGSSGSNKSSPPLKVPQGAPTMSLWEGGGRQVCPF